MIGRLLIVDDERGIRDCPQGAVYEEGYAVETAQSGEEALAKVQAGQFHVIITDLNMKGISGLDLLRAAASSWTPMLGSDDHRLRHTADRRRGDEGWGGGYLPKPFDVTSCGSRSATSWRSNCFDALTTAWSSR